MYNSVEKLKTSDRKREDSGPKKIRTYMQYNFYFPSFVKRKKNEKE